MSGAGWIAGLYLLGIALIILELFTPGLVLGLLGVASLGTSIWLLFAWHGPLAGALGLAGGIGALAAIGAVAVRRLRHGEAQDLARYSVADPALATLRGARAVAVSPLRPAGVVRLGKEHGERRIDVVTRGEMIEAGTVVEVIEVEGNRIVVRAAG